MRLYMRNDLGLTREVSTGISIFALFFGGLVFLVRGMPVHGLLWIVLSMFTSGLSNVVLMVLINRITAVHYLGQGYYPTGPGWDKAARKWNIILPAPPSPPRQIVRNGFGQTAGSRRRRRRRT